MENNKTAKIAEMYRALEECFYCPKCGAPIEGFTKVSYTRKEMLKGYECSFCGFHGVQHFTLAYTHTEEGILK